MSDDTAKKYFRTRFPVTTSAGISAEISIFDIFLCYYNPLEKGSYVGEACLVIGNDYISIKIPSDSINSPWDVYSYLTQCIRDGIPIKYQYNRDPEILNYGNGFTLIEVPPHINATKLSFAQKIMYGMVEDYIL